MSQRAERRLVREAPPLGGDPSHSLPAGFESLASRTSLAGWPELFGRQARIMACGAAERGPEPPAFQRHPEAIAPRLAHGYGLRRELRDLEFGRLAGERWARVLAGICWSGTSVRDDLSLLGGVLCT